jgi:hypothetical protein
LMVRASLLGAGHVGLNVHMPTYEGVLKIGNNGISAESKPSTISEHVCYD